LEAQARDQSLWCYREQHQEDGKPDKTLQVCQTNDGELERLVALNGRETELFNAAVIRMTTVLSSVPAVQRYQALQLAVVRWQTCKVLSGLPSSWCCSR